MSLTLPVSIGEALDKFSILDIKLENIKDSRRDDVLLEYTLLQEILNPYLKLYDLLYKLIKVINKKIWDLLTDQRKDDLSVEMYALISKKVVEENDARFRTKDKINLISKSIIKEKKGYDLMTKDVEIEETEFSKIIFEILKESVYCDVISVKFAYEIDSNLLEQIKQHFSYDQSIKFEN